LTILAHGAQTTCMGHQRHWRATSKTRRHQPCANGRGRVGGSRAWSGYANRRLFRLASVHTPLLYTSHRLDPDHLHSRLSGLCPFAPHRLVIYISCSNTTLPPPDPIYIDTDQSIPNSCKLAKSARDLVSIELRVRVTLLVRKCPASPTSRALQSRRSASSVNRCEGNISDQTFIVCTCCRRCSMTDSPQLGEPVQ
jgi:hypothetical protein